MEARETFIGKLRGATEGTIDRSCTEETFQNQVIRPILKLQNDLFLDVFRNYIAKYKNEFHSYPAEKKMQYIENAIHKDIKFRNSLKGMVIAIFTLTEYNEYIKNSSNLNKRMMNMLIERLKSQVILFEHA